MEYKCYAIPAATRKTCGHMNKIGRYHGLGSNKLLCCEKCGCTKIASDSRKKEKQNG